MDDEEAIERAEQLRLQVDGHPEHVAEALPQLLALLHAADAPAVLVAVIRAIGAAWDEEGNLALLPWADHADPEVRFEVACAVPGGTDSFRATEEVAETLMRLMRDDSDDVRDWATFGLGRQLEIDTDAVREALLARTTDGVPAVRGEAIVGLARRRDRRIVPMVQQLLARDEVDSLLFEAAELLADPALLAGLRRWSDDPDHPDDPDAVVDRALRACDPEVQSARLERHRVLLAAIEASIEEQGLSARVAMYCDRFTSAVLLTVDPESPLVRDVDSLLAHTAGDVARAVQLVIGDIEGNGR
jgi:hypothetical protein